MRDKHNRHHIYCAEKKSRENKWGLRQRVTHATRQFSWVHVGATCCRMTLANKHRVDTKSRRYMHLTMSNKLAAATAYCIRPETYILQSDTSTHSIYRQTDGEGDGIHTYIYSAKSLVLHPVLCLGKTAGDIFFAACSALNVSFQGQTRRHGKQVNTGVLKAGKVAGEGGSTNYHVN